MGIIINPYAVQSASTSSLAFDSATKGTNCTLSAGDKRITSTTTAWSSAKCLTSYSSGKRHAEFKITAVATAGALDYAPMFGVVTSAAGMNTYLYAAATSSVIFGTDTECKYNHLNGGQYDFLPAATPKPTVNDRFGISIDFDAKKIWLWWKGAVFNGGDPAAGTGAFTYTGTPAWLLAASVYGLNSGELVSPIYTPSGFAVW